MMLQEIERHTPACIQRHDFPVDECIGREPFTGLGDMGKLLCEKVLSPGPESHSGGISPGKTTVSVELNLVEPFLAVGQALNQSCIHGLDEPDFSARQRTEGLGSHEEYERSRPCCSASYLINLFARASTSGGIVTPICFAVLRLITSSNFLGCSTGRSAGFAPFRILST